MFRHGPFDSCEVKEKGPELNNHLAMQKKVVVCLCLPRAIWNFLFHTLSMGPCCLQLDPWFPAYTINPSVLCFHLRESGTGNNPLNLSISFKRYSLKSFQVMIFALSLIFVDLLFILYLLFSWKRKNTVLNLWRSACRKKKDVSVSLELHCFTPECSISASEPKRSQLLHYYLCSLPFQS